MCNAYRVWITKVDIEPSPKLRVPEPKKWLEAKTYKILITFMAILVVIMAWGAMTRPNRADVVQFNVTGLLTHVRSAPTTDKSGFS